MQPVWLCILSGKHFEETFRNTQWRKVKQMQLMRLCILLCQPFEDTFENTLWRKTKQVWPMWLCIQRCKQFAEALGKTHWSQTNAIFVTLHLLSQLIFWKKLALVRSRIKRMAGDMVLVWHVKIVAGAKNFFQKLWKIFEQLQVCPHYFTLSKRGWRAVNSQIVCWENITRPDIALETPAMW